MRKLLFACLLALGLSVLFSSCEKEGSYGSSDSYANMILGEWVLEKEEGEKALGLNSLYFTYSIVFVYDGHSQVDCLYCIDERDSSIHLYGEDFVLKILKLTKSKLELKCDAIDEEVYNTHMYYKRK